MYFSENIGMLIKTERIKKGMSIKDLAKLSVLNEKKILNIESGKIAVPSPKILKKISLHLAVSYEDLMFASGQGSEVTLLNPFLNFYYSNLKGKELQDNYDCISEKLDEWNESLKEIKIFLKRKNISEETTKLLNENILDLEHQINTAREILRLLKSMMIKEKIKNEKKLHYVR